MQLDKELNFEKHLSKVQRLSTTIRKLHNVLPRSVLLRVYKSFIRPHLDYGDIIYDKAFDESFQATLAITGAIRGSSAKKIYEKLSLESLKSRRWYRKMSFLNNVFNTIPNSYIHNVKREI